MIRVAKNPSRPNMNNLEALNQQLLKDQNGKCYICERRMGTDYQIEHLKSQVNYPQFKKEWTNLFLACSYCNGRKSDNFDKLIEPHEHNIESYIIHKYHSEDKRFSFLLNFIPSGFEEQYQQTSELLRILFNGKGNIRNIKEMQFYNDFFMEWNDFNELVDNYCSNKNLENKENVVQSLKHTDEFLGFKYWLILEHPTLKRDFEEYLIWNKK